MGTRCGALMNQCIHGIDLLRWMMGDDIDEIYGVTRQQFHNYLETEDVGIAIIKFKNGAIATVEGTTNVYPENLEETLYLFGENGTVKMVVNLLIILTYGNLLMKQRKIRLIKFLKNPQVMFTK